MNVGIAKFGRALRVSEKARFKFLGLIWIVLGMLALSHIHNLFPANTVREQYYAVTFNPGSSAVWPPVVHAINEHAHLWATTLGVWIVLMIVIVIHFVVAYAEEIGRGIQNYERRIIEEKQGGEATASGGPKQAAQAQSQAQQQGGAPIAQPAAQTTQNQPSGAGLRGRTILELLSLEFLAEFVAEAVYSFFKKKKGVPS